MAVRVTSSRPARWASRIWGADGAWGSGRAWGAHVAAVLALCLSACGGGADPEASAGSDAGAASASNSASGWATGGDPSPSAGSMVASGAVTTAEELLAALEGLPGARSAEGYDTYGSIIGGVKLDTLTAESLSGATEAWSSLCASGTTIGEGTLTITDIDGHPGQWDGFVLLVNGCPETPSQEALAAVAGLNDLDGVSLRVRADGTMSFEVYQSADASTDWYPGFLEALHRSAAAASVLGPEATDDYFQLSLGGARPESVAYTLDGLLDDPLWKGLWEEVAAANGEFFQSYGAHNPVVGCRVSRELSIGCEHGEGVIPSDRAQAAEDALRTAAEAAGVSWRG